jgi:Clp amino terminal domain, pathogenicity island component
MFQRYTEKARRVIFFARYEAGQYGSPYIEREHLLLGFLREDRVLVKRFLGGGEVETTIRAEVEKHIPPRERICNIRGGPTYRGFQESLAPGGGRGRPAWSPARRNGTPVVRSAACGRLAGRSDLTSQRSQAGHSPRRIRKGA